MADTSIESLTCALDRLEALVRRGLLRAAGEGAAAADPFQGLHLDRDAITRLLARRRAGDEQRADEEAFLAPHPRMRHSGASRARST
jgi:hypothetical protein